MLISSPSRWVPVLFLTLLIVSSAGSAQVCLDTDDGNHLAAHVGTLTGALSFIAGHGSPQESVYAFHVPGMEFGQAIAALLFQPCGDQKIVFDPFCDFAQEGTQEVICAQLACTGDGGDWSQRAWIGNTPLATDWRGTSWGIETARTQFDFDAATSDVSFTLRYDITEVDGDLWDARADGILLAESFRVRLRLGDLLDGAQVSATWMADALDNFEGTVRSSGQLLGTLVRKGEEIVFEPVPSCL